jgi:hypothetical protein
MSRAARTIAPTPERLAKGDVVARQNRTDASGRDAGVTYEAKRKRQTPDPIAVLLEMGRLTADLAAVAMKLRALYHRAHKGPGVVDLNRTGHRGTAYAESEPQRRFRALCLCVHETPEERQARWNVLIPVVCLETPVRHVAFTHRRYEVAIDRIVASLARMAAWLDAEHEIAA